jgi:pimeloyl-ACP methyl ester carboxylesterase
MSIEKTTSADGTTLAYEVMGEGPPLILVAGAFCDRNARVAGTPLARLLAPQFRVYSYDRRGRGESANPSPSPDSVAREVADLAAIVKVTGATPFVYGHSSGAVLALNALAHGVPARRLALYEPPFFLDPADAAALTTLADELTDAATTGRRDDAVELFLTRGVRRPPAVVASMRANPVWGALAPLAHTLHYDARLTASSLALRDRLASISVPVVVLDGSESPPFLREAARLAASVIPGARQRTVEGQTHDVNIEVLAPLLVESFGS